MQGAASSVFVPVTDELIFDHPELIEGPLVPYHQGMACHGWLSVELNPEEGKAQSKSNKPRAKTLLHKVIGGLSSDPILA